MKNKPFLERIKSYQARGVFQVCEFAVIEPDKSENYFFAGSSNLTAGRLWDLASVSKVVGLGTILIQRILSGRLELDAPLVRFYPAWHESNVTLRQLLTHTSGINPFIENRDLLDSDGLTAAINQLKVSSDKTFHYTDVNFILLGFMLETLEGRSLDQIFQHELFGPWQMWQTSFGPVENAVATLENQPAGLVHDPKAQVLGRHCGSAGLFSRLSDLTSFVQAYFADEAYLRLLSDFTETDSAPRPSKKPRSLAWDLLPNDFLLHTGYTGTFILINLRRKEAVIFLSNRVYYRDERRKWIAERDLLITDFLNYFSQKMKDST